MGDLKPRRLGPIRVTGSCSHLFCFTQGNRNPKESHWVPALQTHPITPVCPVPSVPLISPWASASPLPCTAGGSEVSSCSNSPAENQTHPLENWGLPLLHSALQWHHSYAAPNPLSESKSLTNLVQTLSSLVLVPRPFHLFAQDTVENSSSPKPALWVFASCSSKGTIMDPTHPAQMPLLQDAFLRSFSNCLTDPKL